TPPMYPLTPGRVTPADGLTAGSERDRQDDFKLDHNGSAKQSCSWYHVKAYGAIGTPWILPKPLSGVVMTKAPPFGLLLRRRRTGIHGLVRVGFSTLVMTLATPLSSAADQPAVGWMKADRQEVPLL